MKVIWSDRALKSLAAIHAHISAGNPNGIAPHSPRLPYSATLGARYATPNPEGVPSALGAARSRCRNLFEVGTERSPSPKVAEYSNLGLEDAIPLGLPASMSKLDGARF